MLGNRQRVAQPTAPAEEARAVGFELRGGDHLALDHREVRDPDRRFLRRTRTAGGDQRAELGQPLGLHEQLGEGRVRIVGGRRREHQFGIGGEFDIACAASVVGQGDLAYLAIVLAGDQHFETGGQRVLALQELGVMFLEEHFAAGHFRAARLQRRRPHRAALGIAQEDEAAPVVTRGVLAPARHGDVAPAAVARAGRGDHQRIAAIGQQLGDRRATGDGDDAPQRGLFRGAAGGDGHFLGARMGQGDIPWHAFLQQQFAGLDHRFAVEARAHPAILQGIGDGDDGHALVVGHEAVHQRHAFIVRQPRAGEVQRLVEAVAALRAHLVQAGVVAPRRLRIDHGRQAGRVGGDHHVLGQPALESQPRHAEVGVLVGELQVARVVGGLGDAPGNAQRAAIGLLARHHQAIGLLQQAARRRAHHQRRHQVFEHRAGPGNQRRTAGHRRRRAA
ncbi:hypothetical protein D3C78_815180 [compost metagenome]